MTRLYIPLTIAFLACAASSFAEPDPPIGTKEQVLLDGYRLGSFTQMHQIYPSRIVHRAGEVRILPRHPVDFSRVRYRVDSAEVSLEEYFLRADVTGFIVLKDGQIAYETYRQGTTELDVFASWSMAKSITSTLVGLAIADGYIAGVEDRAVTYVPALQHSAYKDNSLKDLLQMSSGVRFVEDYVDTHSVEATAWFSGVINQQLPYNSTILWFDTRDAAPGTRFYYASLEPQVTGWAVRDATGHHLSHYFSEKVWQRLGAEQSAYWMLDRPGGMEIASCCLSATLRDYARLGQLFADGGKVGKEQVVPEDWIITATQADPEKPYLHAGTSSQRVSQMGYQHYWWLWPGEDRAFSAIGFGGQEMYINPERNIVIVQTAAWGAEQSKSLREETHRVFQRIVESL